MKPVAVLKNFLLCAFAIFFLFLSFFVNYWGIAEQSWFATHQQDSESYIIGRLVQSQHQGVFSAGGLPGFGSFDGTPVRAIDQPFAQQYWAYLHNQPFVTYTTTHSQIGGQGILFSLLNNLIPASPQSKLRWFYALTAFLTALIITAICAWFYGEFGWMVALFVFASALFSQWLGVFARNLWWSLWSFYLPMVAMIYYLRAKPTVAALPLRNLSIIAFVTVLIKCVITGYEYMTTTLIMMVVPVVYYLIRQRVNAIQALKNLTILALSSLLAVLISFVLLCLQIAAVEGSFQDGVDHIIYSLQKRTHIEPVAWKVGDLPADFAPSLEASTLVVVGKYLVGVYFDASNYLSASPFVAKYVLKIRYIHLLLLFAGVSFALYVARQRDGDEMEAHKRLALLYTMWFSLLAPLSWFVIFKAHSYIHTHMNFIVWQMPFTFFGFAACGLLVERFWLNRRSLNIGSVHR
jgi:hypothetical protein